MRATKSDALVFFGATGDLAHLYLSTRVEDSIIRGHLHPLRKSSRPMAVVVS